MKYLVERRLLGWLNQDISELVDEGLVVPIEEPVYHYNLPIPKVPEDNDRYHTLKYWFDVLIAENVLVEIGGVGGDET